MFECVKNSFVVTPGEKNVETMLMAVTVLLPLRIDLLNEGEGEKCVHFYFMGARYDYTKWFHSWAALQ